MRKSTGNILQDNDQASLTSPFAPHKMLTQSNINNFKPPQKTRTSWAPANTQTDSKLKIPGLSGLGKIQQSTPSSLREFRSSAPAKLTPRSLFAFRSIGDNSALNQEEEQEDSLFMDEKDIVKESDNPFQADESPKDQVQQVLKDREENVVRQDQEESNFLYEDTGSDSNEQGLVNAQNDTEIYKLFQQNKQNEQGDDESEI